MFKHFLFKCAGQAGLELIIILPLPPSSNPTSMYNHNWLNFTDAQASCSTEST